MPLLLVLTFCAHTHARTQDAFSGLSFPFTSHSSLRTCHFSLFKPQSRLQSVEFQLLLPALDCLLPIAKVILSVIQLKSLYFLMDTFFLPQGPFLLQVSFHPSAPPPTPPPANPTSRAFSLLNGSPWNWMKVSPQTCCFKG